MSEQNPQPLEMLVSLVTEKVAGDKDNSMPYVGLEHMPSDGSTLLAVGSAGDSVSTNNVFRTGDTLFGKLRPQLRKCVRVSFDGYCSTDILVLRANSGSCSEYGSKLLQSEFVFTEAIRTEEGTKMPRTSWRAVKDVQVFCPSLPQQRKIAKILTTVDNLIDKTEALIAKYQAVKQGMMHDLFTRGVDEHGHLRPTYDEAPELYKESELGWIPMEWEQTTVGREILGIDAGKSPDCPDMPAPPGEWGVLKVSAVQPDGFRSQENKVIANSVLINPSYEVHDGDLLISRSNTYQLVGIVCFVRSPQPRLMLCDKTLRLRCDPRRANTEFMFWLLQQPSVRRQIEIHATGTSGSMKNISQPVIRRLKIVLPSTNEQDRITSRIQSLQDSIAAERRTQRKLRTQKTGLMQDLLTGKVRVKLNGED